MAIVVRCLYLAVLVGAIAFALTTGKAEASPVKNKETCRASSFTEDVRSFAFKSLILRARMTASWCYDGQRVTKMEVVCKVVDFDRVTIAVDSCSAQYAFISWRGVRNGSAYAIVAVHYANCVFKYGCWQSAVLNIERRFFANGHLTSPKEES